MGAPGQSEVPVGELQASKARQAEFVICDQSIEPSFRDTKGRFGLALTQVGQAARLGRLVVGLTLALTWLSLAVLPEVRAKPPGWEVAVAQWGRASVIKLALELFDRQGGLPRACLPQAP